MKGKMFLVILVLAVAGVAAAAYFLSGVGQEAGRAVVRIGTNEFRVDVSDTPFLRSRGLSRRESLGENESMLFIFNSPGSYGFWMKDMKFAIDIVWIHGDKIVGFAENLQPEPEKTVFGLTTYYPPEAVDRVLEVNAGTVARSGFKVGDLLHFNK